MIGIFFIIFLVIIAIMFIGAIIFLALIVFGFNKMGYKKTAKWTAVSILSILFLGGIFLMYNIFKEKKISKEDIVKSLSYTKIKLQDDFEIIKQKEEWDFTYNRINFTLKISENDFLDLKKQYPNFIVRDSICHSSPSVYDTLKVKIDKDKKLYFYRANHNFDN